MVDKIINTFDVWITAQGLKSKGRLRGIDNVSLEGIERLRELILELAIQGKLSSQGPDAEVAKVSLSKIFQEKKQLIKDGKISKQEALEEVKADDAPFKLPHNWLWTKLGNLAADIHYGYTASANEQIDGVRLLRITDIQNDSVNWESVPGCEIEDNKVSGYQLKNGDILIARTGGTIGKSYLVKNISLNAVFASYLIRVKKLDNTYPEFIKVFLGSKLYWDQLRKNSMGTGQPNVNGNALKNLILPFPPLEEQHRIVAKIDELMALCDELEKQEIHHVKSHQLLIETLLGTLTRANDAAEFQTAWSRLAQHFDDIFTTEESIDQLKQTILQLAVMGKLVPQDPNDEPASELLKRIEKEKERLLKQQQIKTPKSDKFFQMKNKPFLPPNGWKFVALESLSNPIYPISYGVLKPGEDDPNGILLVKSQHINQNVVSRNIETRITRKLDQAYKRTRIKGGEILLNLVGASIGRTAIAPNWLRGANVSRAVAVMTFVDDHINKTFLQLYFQSFFTNGNISKVASGSAQPVLNLGQVKQLTIPIPPLNEQDRIVSKVEELFALCDRLKERIAEAQKVANQMADSILEQV